MEARIAALESDVRHIRDDVSEIKTDIRRLDAKIDGVQSGLGAKIDATRDSIASAKVWALLLYIAQSATLLGIMAHAVGWLE